MNVFSEIKDRKSANLFHFAISPDFRRKQFKEDYEEPAKREIPNNIKKNLREV